MTEVSTELVKIKSAVDRLKEQYPDYSVIITVSRKFNDEVVKHLGAGEYGILLHEMYGCKYSVSPFMDIEDDWVVGLFDYGSILGQWNTFADKQYKLSHLFSIIKQND